MKISNEHIANNNYRDVYGNTCYSDISYLAQRNLVKKGTELEHKIYNATINKVGKLDTFIEDCHKHNVPYGVYICNKQSIRNSILRQKGKEVDFLLFDVTPTNITCTILELKRNSALDTKKCKAEKAILVSYEKYIKAKLKGINIQIIICGFLSKTQDEMLKDLKGNFSKDEIMTGKELCSLLNINYDKIVKDEDINHNINIANEMAFNEMMNSNYCGITDGMDNIF